MINRHLVRGSRGFEYPLDEGSHLVVAAWITYADETGTQGSPRYCLVCGFVGNPRQWRTFDKEWNAVLKKYKVREFHSKYFFHRKQSQGKSEGNPFANWSDEKAQKFLKELVEYVLMPRRLFPVGGGVYVPDFNSYTKAERRYLTNAEISPKGIALTTGAPSRPYQLGLISLMYDAIEKARKDVKVHFVLDFNSKEEGLARQLFNFIRTRDTHPDWNKIGRLSYACSEEEPGLQVADLYNYVWQRYLVQSDKKLPIKSEEHYVVQHLEMKQKGIKVWTKEGLNKLLNNLTQQQRQKLREEL